MRRFTNVGWTFLNLSCCWIAIIFIFFNPGNAEECTVGVAVGTATSSGRPILWKNRDASFQNNEVAFFVGEKYDFIGIINADDTTQVWAGINTAGFAIINSESLDLDGDSVDAEGYFMKKALGFCGSIEKFEALLNNTNRLGRGTKSNFGVIDALGNGAFFEVGNQTFKKFDAQNSTVAPFGFLVRSNFAMSGGGKAYAHSRYHRAKELFTIAASKRALDVRYVLQSVARDLKSYNVNPYPLPFEDSQNGAPQGLIDTQRSINRYRTVSCVVFEGVKANEDQRLSTMWCILGEPICGAAVPLWACAGPVSAEIDGERGSALNQAIQRKELRAYHNKNFPTFIDSHVLMDGRRALLPWMLKIENDNLEQTALRLADWRSSKLDIKKIQEFEKNIIRETLRGIR